MFSHVRLKNIACLFFRFPTASSSAYFYRVNNTMTGATLHSGCTLFSYCLVRVCTIEGRARTGLAKSENTAKPAIQTS